MILAAKYTMNLSADILNEIIQMAMRGKSPREIAEYLEPDNVSELMLEFSNTDSKIYEAYRTGNAAMGPDIKLISAQAEIENLNLKRMRKVDMMISEFLGEDITD